MKNVRRQISEGWKPHTIIKDFSQRKGNSMASAAGEAFPLFPWIKGSQFQSVQGMPAEGSTWLL